MKVTFTWFPTPNPDVLEVGCWCVPMVEEVVPNALLISHRDEADRILAAN